MYLRVQSKLYYKGEKYNTRSELPLGSARGVAVAAAAYLSVSTGDV